jgi:hypothetical protein
MTLLKKSLLAAAVGTGVLTLSAVSASADIACVTVVCWHTTDRYEYPTESRVVVHENTWKPDADAKVTWREHTGRGYWREDKWVDFH